MTHDLDLFVIGAGSGGVRAARMAAGYGAKVAIAEEHRVGGTCVIRGCVPKKLMVFAAEFGRAFTQARGYGWSAESARFDWPTLRANLNAEVDRLSAIYRRNLDNAGVAIHPERAELVDAHTVRLMGSGRTLTAKHVLIATGGRPYRPLALEGQEHGFTSNDVFTLQALPRQVIVAGGGYVACEFASIFAGLGVNTRLLYRGETVLRGFDLDVRAEVQEGLKAQGVAVITNAVLAKIERGGRAGLVAHLSTGESVDCDGVMLAIGRVPNTEGLGLEAAGVKVTERGAVKVDAYSHTNVPSISAVGDVTDRIALTPVAIREGAAFAKTVFGGEPTAFDHADVASGVFTSPPVGAVGLSEADARRRFGAVDVYKTRFRPMKHMLSGDAQRVLMKLVVRREDHVVVGCHIVGPEAAEMIQLAAIAVKAKLTKKAWDDTCAVHPTMAEELVTLKEPVAEPKSG